MSPVEYTRGPRSPVAVPPMRVVPGTEVPKRRANVWYPTAHADWLAHCAAAWDLLEMRRTDALVTARESDAVQRYGGEPLNGGER